MSSARSISSALENNNTELKTVENQKNPPISENKTEQKNSEDQKNQPQNFLIPAGQYTINYQNKLGEGSFANTYLGTFNNNTVAVKEMSYLKKPLIFRPIIENEINIMEKIESGRANNPERAANLMKFFGYTAPAGGKCRFIFEFINNGSLAHWIHSPTNPLNWKIAYPIIKDVTSGLNYLHSLKIAHCDIKPSNILLTKDMHAKLIDFGLSQDLTKEENRKKGVGTPIYVAPEILSDTGELSEKSDVFSLGTTIWEMASKKQPYGTLNELSELEKFLVVDKKRLAKPLTCPSKVSYLIDACWETKPENRPSTEELLHELETDINTTSPQLAERYQNDENATTFIRYLHQQFIKISRLPLTPKETAACTTFIDKLSAIYPLQNTSLASQESKTLLFAELLNNIIQFSLHKCDQYKKAFLGFRNPITYLNHNPHQHHLTRGILSIFQTLLNADESVTKFIEDELKINLSDRFKKVMIRKLNANISAFDNTLALKKAPSL